MFLESDTKALRAYLDYFKIGIPAQGYFRAFLHLAYGCFAELSFMRNHFGGYVKMSIIRNLYQCVCCIYSRIVVRDKPADLIMRGLCSLFFRYVHGYWPQYKKPRSFSEKVWRRMFFDRDPRWTLFSDKWRVGAAYLIPVLWHGTIPENIPFDE